MKSGKKPKLSFDKKKEENVCCIKKKEIEKLLLEYAEKVNLRNQRNDRLG